MTQSLDYPRTRLSEFPDAAEKAKAQRVRVPEGYQIREIDGPDGLEIVFPDGSAHRPCEVYFEV